MRKILLLAAACLTILIMSCDDTPEEVNPFVGTWEDGSATRYVFSDTYVTLTTIADDKIWWSGNYSYNDTHVTVTTDYRDPFYEDYDLHPNPFVFSYTFENDNSLLLGVLSLQKTAS